jgi:hypothetical protein
MPRRLATVKIGSVGLVLEPERSPNRIKSIFCIPLLPLAAKPPRFKNLGYPLVLSRREAVQSFITFSGGIVDLFREPKI